MSAIRVLLVDDHKLVLEGTRAALDQFEDVSVVGTASSASQALAEMEGLSPEVVVLDVRLPDMSGIELARQAHQRWPAIQLIAVSGFDDALYVNGLHRVGVRAFLSKAVTTTELVQAIRDVAAGRNRPDLLSGGPDGLVERLTPREFEVLSLMSRGARNGDIAETLSLSIKSVEFHVSHILQKLQARSRSEAIIKGAQLFDPSRVDASSKRF